MQLYDKYKTLFKKYEVNTPLRIAHFMSQIEHESGLNPISENLNYSSDRLLVIFPKYFNKEQALAYSRQQKRIANRVYANRMSNGNEASGDGWKYRGRGFIQITGKENYLKVSNSAGLDCVNDPDLLLEEPNALLSALWFWNSNNVNKYADLNDIEAVTKKINGGLNGIEDRKEKLLKWKSILNK